MNRLNRFVCAAALVAGWSATALAKCNMPPPPCEQLQSVEVAALVRFDSLVDVSNRGWGPLLFRADVLERFKGVPPDVVELRGLFDLTSENLVPKAGQTMLVYARIRGAHFETACTRTKVPSLTSTELRELRQCR